MNFDAIEWNALRARTRFLLCMASTSAMLNCNVAAVWYIVCLHFRVFRSFDVTPIFFISLQIPEDTQQCFFRSHVWKNWSMVPVSAFESPHRVNWNCSLLRYFTCRRKHQALANKKTRRNSRVFAGSPKQKSSNVGYPLLNHNSSKRPLPSEHISNDAKNCWTWVRILYLGSKTLYKGGRSRAFRLEPDDGHWWCLEGKKQHSYN